MFLDRRAAKTKKRRVSKPLEWVIEWMGTNDSS